MAVGDTWTSRELPALTALVEHFDDPDAVAPTWEQAADLAGMDRDVFKRALTKLARADPPYVVGIFANEEPFPVRIMGVTERAWVDTGQWPTPEDLVDRLVAALERAAEDETEPDRRSKMHTAATVVGGMLRGVAVGWVTGELPHPH